MEVQECHSFLSQLFPLFLESKLRFQKQRTYLTKKQMALMDFSELEK